MRERSEMVLADLVRIRAEAKPDLEVLRSVEGDVSAAGAVQAVEYVPAEEFAALVDLA